MTTAATRAHGLPPRFGRRLRSTSPAGKSNCLRSRLSRRRICPWVVFVIVTGQMQQAVQDQYLNFHL